MISVIIPCYNGEQYIAETLGSIIVQQQDLEIIVVDDGSTDQSASIIKSFAESKIIYIFQSNRGVSAARNNGIKHAKGEYIIFFDADDKMPRGFLHARKKVLESNPDVGFCCGPVETFPSKRKLTYGIAENVAEGLLTYLPQYSSCPSNYMIRKSLLVNNNLSFNEQLSSTADRFFLIQLSNLAKGELINEAPLLYRISPDSMSNKITRKLIDDNERYLFQLQQNQLIPGAVKQEFLFKINYILGLGFIRTGEYFKGIKYIITAFIKNPTKFIKQII